MYTNTIVIKMAESSNTSELIDKDHTIDELQNGNVALKHKISKNAKEMEEAKQEFDEQKKMVLK